MLAKMPQRYIIAGDEIAPYLVVMNAHDGSSGIKVAMTPILLKHEILSKRPLGISASGPPSIRRTS